MIIYNKQMKIFLNASEIASMIGKNKFKQPSEVVFRLWQKYFYEDFNDIIQGLEKKSIKVVPRETDVETVKRITKETAVKLISEFEGKRPPSLDIFLSYLNMTEEEFNEII